MPRWLRPTPTHLAIALAALPGLGHALGLGALRGEAYLGEPLRVEIQLVGDSTPPLGRDCVSLQRPEQTPDDGSFPRNMTARIESRAGGQVIVLSTPTSVALPILEFRVSLRCGFNVSREYSLLPIPKSDTAKPGVAESAPPAPPPLASANPKTLRAPSVPDGIAATTYTAAGDMTLDQLADQQFRNQPMRRARFKRWVLEANPALAANPRLSKGQEVAIPAGIPPRRPGDRQDPVTGEFLNDAPNRASAKAATPVKRTPAASPAATEAVAASGSATKPATKDQLKIGGENKPPSFRNMKEAAQIIDRLNTLLEQQLAATVSAQDKLGKLESSVTETQQRLNQAEANMAANEARQKAALQATQEMLKTQDERNQWFITIAGLGGLVLGVIVTLGISLLRRSTRPAVPLFAAPMPVAPHSAEPQSAPPAADVAVETAVPSLDAASAFHREPDRTATIKTVRPSLDFREALAATPEATPPDTVSSPAASVQGATPTEPPATPVTASANSSHIDIELEPSPYFELDPLDFTPEHSTPTPLPAAFESLQTTLPVSSTPLPALDGSEGGPGIVELTNVMVSMGLAASAAETLAKHIAAHPRQSLPHWLKLLEVYRLQGSREAFERTAEEMRTHFNVRAGNWEAETELPTRRSLEDFPHLLRNLQSTWREPGCVQYMHALLTDNRDGTRGGFSQSVAEELLLLIAMLSEQS